MLAKGYVMSERVAVLGAGSFGTALAKLMAEGGHQVTMFARDSAVVEGINDKSRNPKRLKDVQLPAGLRATTSVEAVMDGATCVVSAIPTTALRTVWDNAKNHLPPEAVVVSATKGIENGTLMLVSQILVDVLGAANESRLTYLTGPSFALELARRLPTAVTVAGTDHGTVERVQHMVSNDYFRAYAADDVVGVELGGAVKNVIAIAAGAADGLGFGLNTQAALITRGLAEITRLAMKMGARPATLAGLAGMGDLVLTCTGTLSRNRRVGKMLGQGQSLEQILEELGEVAEGVNTARSVFDLIQKYEVDMPISEGVYRLLFDDAVDPKMAVYELMGRKLKRENA